MENWEKKIQDNALAYQSHPRDRWYASDKKFDQWFQVIHEHFKNNVILNMKSRGELFVEYWPCYLQWRINDIKSLFGTGYVCYSDRQVYLFSFGKLTQRFPLKNVPKGDIGGLWRLFNVVGGGEVEVPAEQDYHWLIPYETISGAQINNNKISLVTPAISWEIIPVLCRYT